MRAIDQTLFTLLRVDATLQGLGVAVDNVHRNKVPDDQPLPGIVYMSPPGEDDYTLTRRASTKYLYTIKVVTEGYDAEELAGRIAARIDAMVNDAALVVVGYTLMNCRRTTDISYGETVGDQAFYHAGGTYEIEVT